MERGSLKSWYGDATKVTAAVHRGKSNVVDISFEKAESKGRRQPGAISWTGRDMDMGRIARP
jgi:hypothetical protein